MNTLRTLSLSLALLGGLASHASAQGYPNPVWDIHPPYQEALAANRPARPDAYVAGRQGPAHLGSGHRAHAPRVTGSIGRHELPSGAVDFREWQLLHSRGR